MRPTVDQLHTSGRYALIESFTIDEMNQFLMREMGMAPRAGEPPGKRTRKSWLVTGITVLLGDWWVSRAVRSFASERQEPGRPSLLWQIGAAFAGFLLLLPIHEFIHGLTFKRVGAPKIGYGYSLKNLMVYAYSQNFPATTRELAFVAVVPFIVITAALLVGWALLPA